MKFIRFIFLSLNIILILALFTSYMSPFISPEANRYIPLFGLFFPYFFFVNVLFAIGWLFTKKWTYGLLSAAALLIGFGGANKFMSFDSPKVIKSPNIIQITSYNVASGMMIGKSEKEQFYSFLKEQYNDGIFFFQESSTTILDKLQRRYPNEHFVRLKGKRATIMSHYPVLDSGILAFADAFNTCVWADIKVNGEKVRIYSVHLQTNKVTQIADDVIAKGDLGDKETWGNVKTMMGRYSNSTVKRLDQVEKIIANIEKINYPVIVAGDFNDIPQSYLYTKMSDKLQDAFVQKGFGLGTSFNGNIPALRIDYIFLHRRFQVLDFKTHRYPFSDHYPVSSEVLLR
ncbi:endonuclease/exonuclease/phosphatase family protein [Saprospiraceae bacterium]|nr:endonuclease/exonuclease/phosphatase family protein [Saprospiraceae bacterium]